MKGRNLLKGTFFCLALAVICMGSGAMAQESLNVGYVDLDRIRQEFVAYQAALKEIQAIRDKEQVKLDELADTFDQNLKHYELKEGLWPSEEEKNKQFEELRSKWNILNDTKTEKDRELEMMSRQKLEPLIKRIKDGIQEVSRSNGKHLVFKQRDLAYFDPRLDITDKVLQYLNQG